MRLASFDIFDTTLLRRCGRPEAVWNALAENLFPEEMDLQEAFVVWRRNAQGETLEEKYDGIDSSFLYFSGIDKKGMMQAEEAVERAMLILNPSVCRLIEQRRAEGYRIAFISDMYLSSQFLRQVLESYGFCQA